MKKLLTLLAFPVLLCLMPMTAMAETINTVTSTETITKTSTVYVGEVVVDGETQIKYLYSGDLTLSGSVRYNLLDGLNGMADGDYAALFELYWPLNYSPQDFAFCSNPELIASMVGNWSSAQYVGMLYYPDKTVTSEINSNLYDYDEGFRAALDAQTQESIEFIDTPANVEKCIVSHIGSHAYENVYYTVEDGQAIKHVDTFITFDCEATTVIYTKVELASGSTSSVLGDVDGDGTVSITDVAMIVNYILGVSDDNFIIANADINGDGEIDINDVMATVSIILGDDKPISYLTCPDDNHPHLIDLGLPSGTKWSCCNVGATTPEGYGGYFAWGEMEEKDYYDWSTYIHCDGSLDTCHDIGSDIASTSYDVAHVQWGGSWMMPSLEQFQELLNNCSSQDTLMNGVNGRLFTGSNGGTTFLPYPGNRFRDFYVNTNSRGFYWSSTRYSPDPDDAFELENYSGNAYDLCIDSRNVYWSHGGRKSGKSVRPVWVQ